MIELSHISKEFVSGKRTVHAVQDVSLTIDKGEIFGIIGFSGAGKSTLVRCINLLERPTSGTVTVDGQDMLSLSAKELRQARKKIGMIFQHFNLMSSRTVAGNVAYPLRGSGLSKQQIAEKVQRLLDLVGIGDKAEAYPKQLSGGQKQRVAIARALTMNPSILLCDEATSALDPNTTTSILDLLKQINQELGITIIIVTHQMEVVRQVCNRACILENGVISSIGSVKELFMDQPKALLRLLGEEDRKLPSEGKNVRIAQIINSREQGEIFASMYSDLGFIFSIVDGTIQAYEDDNMGIFTLNVPDDKYDELTNYLNEKGISWIDAEKENAEVQA